MFRISQLNLERRLNLATVLRKKKRLAFESFEIERTLDVIFETPVFMWTNLHLLFPFDVKSFSPFFGSMIGYDEVAYKLVHLCEGILHRRLISCKINNAKFERLLDLLIAVRDPHILCEWGSNEFSRRARTVITKVMQEFLVKRRSSLRNVDTSVNIELFSLALYRGDAQLVKFFLRFGVYRPPPRIIKKNGRFEEREFSPERLPVNNTFLVTDGEVVIFHNLACTCEICEGSTNYIMLSNDGESRRALFVAGAILRELRWANHENRRRGREFYPDVAMCQHLQFQVIPEPFVTFNEVEQMVHQRKRGSDEYWKHFLQRYKEHHPESLKPYQPRSLFHLSRCEVRNSLLNAASCSHGLPSQVEILPLPPKLKRFILADGRQ